MSETAATTPFRNVFILCTGRNGSQTFIRACDHFSNYSAGHETLARELGEDRLDYPAGHIEADNRLSWFLGKLEQRFGDEAFYVQLKRDPDKIAESYDQRWDHRFSLIEGYNRAILMQRGHNPGAARDMVETITANIDVFLSSKTHVIEIDIDAPDAGFREFAQMIGADGDVEAALSEFRTCYNQTNAQTNKPSGQKNLRPWELKQQNDELQASQAEMQRERLEEQQKFLRLQASLKELKSKTRKKEKKLRLLALPTVVLLAPLWLPFAVPAALRRRKKKRLEAQKRDMISLVCDAFNVRNDQGSEAAIEVLQGASAEPPAGAIDLFRAIDAGTDASWLPLFNAWGKANKVPEVTLAPGTGSRFGRMQFVPLPQAAASDLVTIIIPCFKAEDSVGQAIDSILNQTWRNLEVIAVNDASPDGTGAILEKIAERDNRVRVLHNSVNVGPYVSKNRALQLARGTYVTGHDSDDIALPDRIENQVRHLKAHGKAKATIGFMVRLNDDGAFDAPVKSVGRTYDGVASLCPISMMCVTQTLRETLGGWDCIRFGADSELIERMEKVLGKNFIRDERILMLCLSGAANLTNDPLTGTNTAGGLSPVRRTYIQQYRAWHLSTPATNLFLPFPHDPRHFDAPDKMLVPADDVRRLVSGDR